MKQLTRRELGLIAGVSAASAMAATARPNVIIVLADDQGYGDFSSHGHPHLKTPELDRFRSESVRFTDFHAAPMCTPTRGQLMTGRNCLFNRAMNVSSGRTLLRRDLPTLAEAFVANQYRTGIFGKWHLGDNYPYRPQERGFQESVWYASSHIGSAPDALEQRLLQRPLSPQRKAGTVSGILRRRLLQRSDALDHGLPQGRRGLLRLYPVERRARTAVLFQSSLLSHTNTCRSVSRVTAAWSRISITTWGGSTGGCAS